MTHVLESIINAAIAGEEFAIDHCEGFRGYMPVGDQSMEAKVVHMSLIVAILDALKDPSMQDVEETAVEFAGRVSKLVFGEGEDPRGSAPGCQFPLSTFFHYSRIMADILFHLEADTGHHYVEVRLNEHGLDVKLRCTNPDHDVSDGPHNPAAIH